MFNHTKVNNMMKNLLNLTNRYYAALINLVLNYIFVSMIVKVICGKKKRTLITAQTRS